MIKSIKNLYFQGSIYISEITCEANHKGLKIVFNNTKNNNLNQTILHISNKVDLFQKEMRYWCIFIKNRIENLSNIVNQILINNTHLVTNKLEFEEVHINHNEINCLTNIISSIFTIDLEEEKKENELKKSRISLIPKTGTLQCKFCNNFSYEGKFPYCDHFGCRTCIKNSYCFNDNCIMKNFSEDRQYYKMCFRCKFSSNNYLDLLCDHCVCKKCFHPSLKLMKYVCLECVGLFHFVICDQCGNQIKWAINVYPFWVKTCCYKKICGICLKLINEEDTVHACTNSKKKFEIVKN